MAEENRAPNLLPAVVILGACLWMFTMTGGGDVFVEEVLGKAYDSQGEHFLRGDVGVDAEVIAHEVLIVDGKARMYFGPFPAFLRIPLNLIYPSGRGYWSRALGFCAGMIALAAFAGLARMALRSSQLSSRWRNWVGKCSSHGGRIDTLLTPRPDWLGYTATVITRRGAQKIAKRNCRNLVLRICCAYWFTTRRPINLSGM